MQRKTQTTLIDADVSDARHSSPDLTAPGGVRVSGALLRKGRSALQRLLPGLNSKVCWPARGLFQPYNYALPDRCPWLFEFAAANLGPQAHIRSFGCSVGDEPFSLRSYFPAATIRGLDISPANIVRRRYRARAAGATRSVATAANTVGQLNAEFHAIFCLAVP